MNEILVGIPSHDDTLRSGMALAVMTEQGQPNTPRFRMVHVQCSLLAFGFNQLWCIALNNRKVFSHFLMLHADVEPMENGWLRTMVDEMERVGADVLGAVIPLKNETGVTSTAIVYDLANAHQLYDTEDRDAAKRRRLTLREVDEFPETFDMANVVDYQHLQEIAPRPALLVNTGLMLVRLDAPNVEKLFFTINDAVWQRADGKFVCDVEPEDWFFSARAAELGLKVFATRKVKVEHIGSKGYSNFGGWGSLDRDG